MGLGPFRHGHFGAPVTETHPGCEPLVRLRGHDRAPDARASARRPSGTSGGPGSSTRAPGRSAWRRCPSGPKPALSTRWRTTPAPRASRLRVRARPTALRGGGGSEPPFAGRDEWHSTGASPSGLRAGSWPALRSGLRRAGTEHLRVPRTGPVEPAGSTDARRALRDLARQANAHGASAPRAPSPPRSQTEPRLLAFSLLSGRGRPRGARSRRTKRVGHRPARHTARQASGRDRSKAHGSIELRAVATPRGVNGLSSGTRP